MSVSTWTYPQKQKLSEEVKREEEEEDSSASKFTNKPEFIGFYLLAAS